MSHFEEECYLAERNQMLALADKFTYDMGLLRNHLDTSLADIQKLETKLPKQFARHWLEDMRVC